ncbi:MAG: sugar phosphate nucleotidyltransferase [Desulfobacterales bacterium]|nr:sugar phosphate nucleotidyltransferase [Desulfobacterales bacterium]
MKALILAAGYGTRLRPYTNIRPKPLFPINGEPVLGRLIHRLITAGCTGIIINTHHLADQIAAFIEEQTFPIPVTTRYEPSILGTGGAIRNAADFLDGAPFLVINSDIVTDLDLDPVYAYHCRHDWPATLVMHHHPAFNSVVVDNGQFIRSFAAEHLSETEALLAFTGIQVMDSRILSFIPPKQTVSSIAVYQSLLDKGLPIKAYVPAPFYWQDIGTPKRYRTAVLDHTAPAAFLSACGRKPAASDIKYEKLKGDGSDRAWYRLTGEGGCLILADHGIQASDDTCEIDSFIAIGRHLFEKNIPIPQMFFKDRFAGLVFLEDLGDTLLYDWLQANPPQAEVIAIYENVICELLRMAVSGKEGFDPAAAYQGPAYDKPLILEKECRYFVDAFLNGYLHLNQPYETLADEFSRLADQAVLNSMPGFMHRDFQSRNIMIKNAGIYFIDFQGGRIGPVQYDLAALLADPYAALSQPIQAQLLDFAMHEYMKYRSFSRNRFLAGYQACRVCRLMQALGAYGYLTRVKEKPFFSQFIPRAARTLKQDLAGMPGAFPLLSRTVDAAAARVSEIFATRLDL